MLGWLSFPRSVAMSSAGESEIRGIHSYTVVGADSGSTSKPEHRGAGTVDLKPYFTELVGAQIRATIACSVWEIPCGQNKTKITRMGNTEAVTKMVELSRSTVRYPRRFHYSIEEHGALGG